jgi:hypothetical protein
VRKVVQQVMGAFWDRLSVKLSSQSTNNQERQNIYWMQMRLLFDAKAALHKPPQTNNPAEN